MKRFKNILLVVNVDARQQAMARAISLAVQNHARLTVLAVVEDPGVHALPDIDAISTEDLREQLLTDRREQIEGLAAGIARRGIDVGTRVVTGIAFVEIIRQVLRDRHDLVVLAAEGRRGFTERLFGSTSMHLMRKCPCPVWVVKPTKHLAYRRILAAIELGEDFQDSERESLNPLILQLASSLARMDGSQLHIVHVWSVFGEAYMEGRGGLTGKSIQRLRRDTKQEYAKRMARSLKPIDLRGLVSYRHLPRNDDVPWAIVKLAKSKKIDLLVMGTLHRTGLAGFFIGNTAEKVLSEVNCSVLTVKPAGFVTPVRIDDVAGDAQVQHGQQ